MTEPAADNGVSGPDQEARYLPVPVADTTVEAPAPRPIDRLRPAELPAAAVAAAGGFLAGIATFVLARVLRRRSAQRAVGRALARPRRRDGIDVAASRSFLVDIHLLRR
jgi:hypothetical protein